MPRPRVDGNWAGDVEGLARRMLADHDALTPGRLFDEPIDLTAAQAYAVQSEVARLRERRGEKVIGYKVGCVSPAVQQQLKIGEPIFARVFDTGLFSSGVALSYGRFANLAVEGELAVRLGPGVSTPLAGEAACRAAIAAAFPVIELHHYVLRSARPSAAELIANGGMHAGFVAAGPGGERGLADLGELRVWVEDRPVGTVAAAELLHRAIESVGWLAGRLAEAGLALAPGQVVLTGSLLNLYPVGPGARVVVSLAPAGEVTARIDP